MGKTLREVKARGVLAAAALLLAGCNGTLLENRAVCTLDGSGAWVVSRYGPVGLASQLAGADARVICAAR